MLSLVYISTARESITEAMCENILAVSRTNNRADDITGLLVAGQKRFLQALEGPEDAVRQAYTRIAADPRHFACVKLGERTTDTRQFGDWEMGYSVGNDAADDAGLEAIVAALVDPVPDPSMRAQFTGFAALHAQAA